MKAVNIISAFVLLFCIHEIKGLDFECSTETTYQINLSDYPSGNVYSPGYLSGKNYSTDIQCQLRFRSPNGTYIRLKFNDVDIETNDVCKSDYLSIYEFSNQGNAILRGRYCGKIRVNDMMSLSSYVILTLASDYMRTSKGYNISFELSRSSNLCRNDEFECKNRRCIKNIGARLCDGHDDCGDGTDEEDCGFPLPQPRKCGSPEIAPITSYLMDRIVGGTEARQGSWPWQVDMQVRAVEPNGHFCGGTLLNAQWFLTAAHCFINTRQNSQMRIHLGNHNKFKKDPYEQIRFVKDYFIWGVKKLDYIKDGKFDMNHDVALVKLNAPVEFNPHVQPACLPSQNEELHVREACIATGWGATRGTSSNDKLKQAQHPVQFAASCHQPYQPFNNKTMICAGRMDPLFGLCHGDSGGPLVCKRNGVWNVYGIASFVTESNMLGGVCGIANKPTVFSKVSAHIDYITKTIADNS